MSFTSTLTNKIRYDQGANERSNQEILEGFRSSSYGSAEKPNDNEVSTMHAENKEPNDNGVSTMNEVITHF